MHIALLQLKDKETEEEEEDCREKISLEEVNAPLPVAKDGVTFNSFIRNKADLEEFKEFLRSTNSKGKLIFIRLDIVRR